MDEIELVVGNKKIKIEISNEEWCRVYCVNDDSIINLGADSLKVIISKLLFAFDINNRKYVSYKGMEIFSIINLMEPHISIVGKDVGDSGLELLCIEDGGTVIPLMTLEEEDIKRWMQQLKGLKDAYSR